MKFILDYGLFEGRSAPRVPKYEPGDKVLIEYWYNGMVTPVKVVSKGRGRYVVSHDIPESKIQNAPEETIASHEIISRYVPGRGRAQSQE